MAIQYRTIDSTVQRQIWEERLSELERGAFRQEVDLAITNAEHGLANAADKAALAQRITDLEEALEDKERRHQALTAGLDAL